MSVLNSWQKIDRVISGKPFGDGSDGAYSSATIPTLTKDSCSGTATSTTLTTAGSTFANGDVLLIHQTRGTGAGQWEINKVASGGGSTSLTLQVALNYTYTDSGDSQAQAIKIPQYTDVTVQSGTWTVPSWDGSTAGGILPLAVKGTLTITGTISGNGVGFIGGTGTIGSDQTGLQGESEAGAGARANSANGTSGGGGTNNGTTKAGGGGGSYGTSGTAGQSLSGTTGGPTGATGGVADLTSLFFGGSGGQGGVYTTNSIGGISGGIVAIFAKNINIGGGIITTGNNGMPTTAGNNCGRGGGGAGGSILLVCATATLGTTLATALGGTGGTGETNQGNGGNGGNGRIAVHHSGTVTGTTNPTFTDQSDTSLVESGASGFFLFM